MKSTTPAATVADLADRHAGIDLVSSDGPLYDDRNMEEFRAETGLDDSSHKVSLTPHSPLVAVGFRF